VPFCAVATMATIVVLARRSASERVGLAAFATSAAGRGSVCPSGDAGGVPRLLLLLRHYRHLCHGQMDARYLRLPDHVDRFQRPANRNALDSSLFRFPPRADEQVNECGIWIPIHGDGSELLVVDLTSLVTHRNSTQTGRDGLAY
jgi:hypothetical protein